MCVILVQDARSDAEEHIYNKLNLKISEFIELGKIALSHLKISGFIELGKIALSHLTIKIMEKFEIQTAVKKV